MDLCKLATLADLERFGSYDYAVPYDWLMKDPEKRRPHFWWYPRTPEVMPASYQKSFRKPGSLMDRPLKWAAVARLALKCMRLGPHESSTSVDLHRYMEVWRFAHPGKPIDAYGEQLTREWINEKPDRAEANEHIIEFAYRHMDIPLPAWLKPTPAVSQAA